MKRLVMCTGLSVVAALGLIGSSAAARGGSPCALPHPTSLTLVTCKKFTLRPGEFDDIPKVGGTFRHPKLARLAGLYARISYDTSSSDIGFSSRVKCRSGWVGSFGGLRGNGKVERLYVDPSLLADARENSSAHCSVDILVDPDPSGVCRTVECLTDLLGSPTLITVEVYASYRRRPAPAPFG